MADKTAIVFGGSRGIGAAVASALARDGFNVAATYTSTEPDLPSTPGVQLTAHKVDIRKPDEVASVFDEVSRLYGSGPTCVVANAGINVPPAPIAKFPHERFQNLVETNIIGAFNMLHEAARHTVDGGTIIGLTTSMVRVGVPGGGPYTASKAAVESLLRSMAKELASRNIRVNGVAPGPVDTDLFRAGKDETMLLRSAGLSPFNRVGQPEEVAEVVSFLASPKASWVHGQIVQPNGGFV